MKMESIFETTPPVLELRDISKSFPGVKALDGVTLKLYAGEVHMLLGENGAGKSSLIKVLYGAYRPDSGAFFVDGKSDLHYLAEGCQAIRYCGYLPRILARAAS
ncbi:ATP-binding cassette domain-containing protein [Undibacterium arcticum]